jgi:hypothetical protein
MITEDLPDPFNGFREIILLKALNSPSPRFSSFLDPAFLNFQSKNLITP